MTVPAPAAAVAGELVNLAVVLNNPLGIALRATDLRPLYDHDNEGAELCASSLSAVEVPMPEG